MSETVLDSMCSGVIYGSPTGAFSRAFYDGISDGHDQPIRTEEKEEMKILLYSAPGFSPNNTTVEEEFVNRTKEFFVNIIGEMRSGCIEYSKKLNIHLKVDSCIYNKYRVRFDNGLIYIYLYEILQERPDITRL